MRRIASIVALLGLSVCSAYTATSQTAEVDKAAPDFTLRAADGKQYTLSAFRGKYVILEWVNFGCPFVHKHYASGNMPRLQKLYAGKGAVWLSICSSAPGKQGYFEGASLKEELVKEKSAATAYLIDSEGTVGKLYEAKATPTMVVIDPQGIVRYIGAIDSIPSTDIDDIANATNYVTAAMDEVTAGKAVAVKSTRAYGCSVKYKD